LENVLGNDLTHLQSVYACIGIVSRRRREPLRVLQFTR
jgi:hypothetical protein